jgi:hypothetical protein
MVLVSGQEKTCVRWSNTFVLLPVRFHHRTHKHDSVVPGTPEIFSLRLLKAEMGEQRKERAFPFPALQDEVLLRAYNKQYPCTKKDL